MLSKNLEGLVIEKTFRVPAPAGEAGLGEAAARQFDVVLMSRRSMMISVRRGRVYDLIHQVNTMRRDVGLDITDRIFLTVPQADRDLLKHRDWIAAETLARSITVGGTLSVVKTT